MRTASISTATDSPRYARHDWLSRDNKTLLEKLQGWRRDRNSGVEGPTVAGLLMFGKWESIREPDAVPQFHVDYREILTDDPLVRWTDRLVPDGTWSANLFQFYQRTITRATRDLKQPFQLHDLTRIDDSPLHQAIREALTNAVIHADYRGKGGIVIIRRRHGFEMSNPGSLLISFEQMQQGGVSECRNRAIQFMFQMMGSGDKGGTGIDTILKGWSGEHWQSPTIQETVNPDRVILRLPMVSLFPDESIARLRARFGDRFNSLSHLEMQALVAADIEGEVSNSRLQLMSASHPVELTKTLQRLVTGDLLIPHGRGRGTTYHLAQPANAVSEAPNVRSDASNAVSSVPQRDQNVGSDLQQMAPSLGSAEFQRLRQQAYPNGIRRKMGNLEMKQAILRICEGRFLTAVQIAQILGREVDALRERFLSPMLREGTLEALYPNSPRHTQQAYRAATLFDNTSETSPGNP